MTERQYLLQHILHLSVELKTIQDPKQRQNTEQALLFYANELQKLDKTTSTPSQS